MGIKEVGICSAIVIILCHGVAGQQTEHIANDIKSMVAIEHTSPEIYLPTNTPTSSHVATLQQCVTSCLEKLGIERRRYLIALIETTNLHGRQKGESMTQRVFILFIASKGFCGD